MKNLACSEEHKAAQREMSVAQMLAELKAAGIHANIFDGDQARSEVPGYVIGSLSMWKFERAWYYWVASGPGLPVEVAEKLHATHGREVRVAGHCGCPSPREWYKGFGVGNYHVDTEAGLAALAAAILSVYDPSKDADAKPYCGSRSVAGEVTDYRSKAVQP